MFVKSNALSKSKAKGKAKSDRTVARPDLPLEGTTWVVDGWDSPDQSPCRHLVVPGNEQRDHARR